MKPNSRVLLLSESFMPYRISLYNEFYEYFLKSHYELSVYSDTKFSSLNYSVDTKFKLYIDKYSISNIKNILEIEKPSIVIFFWSIYVPTSWLIILLLKLKKIPFIYWSQGYSLADPNNKLKGLFYKTVHKLSDSILLYSINELKYVNTNYHNKVFIANNTINFNAITQVPDSKDSLKRKYNIPYKKILLFVGRIQPRKKLEILVDYFASNFNPDIGLVIVGKGLPEELVKKVNDSTNILYLGEMYSKVDEIFKLADLFCIPGANGLGINQAMFWGLPVITLNVQHGPEVFYLKTGINGYICETPKELTDKISILLNDDSELKRLSENAYRIIREEASVEKMAQGFLNSLFFLSH